MQTIQMLENLKNILKSIGLTLHEVVKTSVILSSFGNFQSFNVVYSMYFKINPSARTTTQVGLMAGVLVEINFVSKKS